MAALLKGAIAAKETAAEPASKLRLLIVIANLIRQSPAPSCQAKWPRRQSAKINERPFISEQHSSTDGHRVGPWSQTQYRLLTTGAVLENDPQSGARAQTIVPASRCEALQPVDHARFRR
jgi:hypothetical protein